MKDYIKNRLVCVEVKYLKFFPSLKSQKYNELFHVGDYWKEPENGKLIFVKQESGVMNILRKDSNTDTDKIIEWCYLDDIL